MRKEGRLHISFSRAQFTLPKIIFLKERPRREAEGDQENEKVADKFSRITGHH